MLTYPLFFKIQGVIQINGQIGNYDLAATDSKSLNRLTTAAEVIKNAGYLKDHSGCAGEIIYRNHSILFEQAKSGNFSNLSRVLDIASDKAGRNALEKYINLYFPVRISSESGKLKFCQHKSKEVEDYSNYLIKFDTLKKLHKTSEITLEKLKKIRLEINKEYLEDWRSVVTKYLKWPTTDAPQSLVDLISDGWVTSGVLSFYSYHVGEEGEPVHQRKMALNKILSAKLDGKIFNKNYINQWGNCNSIERLMKLATTIAALCRNAKRSKFNYLKATSEWEDDLAYLKEKYFDQQLNLEAKKWPSTK